MKVYGVTYGYDGLHQPLFRSRERAQQFIDGLTVVVYQLPPDPHSKDSDEWWSARVFTADGADLTCIGGGDTEAEAAEWLNDGKWRDKFGIAEFEVGDG